MPVNKQDPERAALDAMIKALEQGNIERALRAATGADAFERDFKSAFDIDEDDAPPLSVPHTVERKI